MSIRRQNLGLIPSVPKPYNLSEDNLTAYVRARATKAAIDFDYGAFLKAIGKYQEVRNCTFGLEATTELLNELGSKYCAWFALEKTKSALDTISSLMTQEEINNHFQIDSVYRNLQARVSFLEEVLNGKATYEHRWGIKDLFFPCYGFHLETTCI